MKNYHFHLKPDLTVAFIFLPISISFSSYIYISMKTFLYSHNFSIFTGIRCDTTKVTGKNKFVGKAELVSIRNKRLAILYITTGRYFR